MISDNQWVWNELCPMASCAHPMRDHSLIEGESGQHFVCRNCECVMRVNTTVGLLMQQHKEAHTRPETTVEIEQPQPVELPDDLFAPIVGYEDVKWLLQRGLLSPQPVHFLLVGPPASAKSLFLMELERLPGAYYSVGSSSSRAGLRQLLIDLEPRILLIDEMDKVRTSKDYAVLLSLMETGVVTETLYKRHEKVQRGTRVYAAANSDENLPAELLSRFVRLHLKPYGEADFLQVAETVLVQRQNVEPEAARVIAKAVWLDLHSRDVRDAVKVARLARSMDEVTRILATLKNYH